jgi:hypothetical protein
VNKEQKWISSVLLNDEASTNEEMKAHFMKEGKMSKAEADFYVKQRNKALLEDLNFKLRTYKSANKSAQLLINKEKIKD